MKNLLRVVLPVVLLMWQVANAGNPPLFKTLPQSAQPLSSSAGGHPVALNQGALSGLKAGSVLDMSIPSEGTYAIVHDRTIEHSSGNRTFVGHLAQSPNNRIVLTYNGNRANGQIVTPNGEVLVEMQGGRLLLQSARELGLREFSTTAPDFLVDTGSVLSRSDAPLRSAVAANATSVQTTVDLLVLYTPGFSDAYSGDPSMRIDQLVALANQAYVDSGVNMTLRVVKIQQVSYSETENIAPALSALTYQSNSAFSEVPALRARYGADLVTLIRPFSATYTECGRGWMPTAAFAPSLGYSVISSGRLSNGTYCSDYVLAHELGHNLGQSHDHATAASQNLIGVHTYSYGYGISGVFGDIMSYITPRIGKFSNPNILCEGYACGVSETDTVNGANTVLSMNQTKAMVAAYMPAQGEGYVAESGWWWNASASGSGYAIEINNEGRLFMAAFVYASDGTPQWFVTSNANTTTTGTFAGSLLAFRDGQTFSGAYHAPGSPSNLGTVTLKFTDSQHGTITWPGGRVTSIQRFDIVNGGAINPGTRHIQTGWYWNADQSGRGFFLEEQQNTVFMAGFMYADDGRPMWYVATVPVNAGSGNTSGANWMQFGNGQPFGGTYKAPTVTNSNVAPAIVYYWGGGTQLSMRLPTGSYLTLQRFAF